MKLKYIKGLFSAISIAMLVLSCTVPQSNRVLIKVQSDNLDEFEAPCGYIDSDGATVIPMGKYAYCFTDTIRDLGMVLQKGTGKIVGIDQNGKELFEVFKYDNGPDYVANGLFRIIKNGKIGYADLKGNILIEPIFDCAYPFEEEYAQVSESCEIEMDGDHASWKSDDWYYITKDAKRAEQ